MSHAEDDRGHDGPYLHTGRVPASVDPLSAWALRPCLAVPGRTGRRLASVPATVPRRRRVLAGALAVSAPIATQIYPAALGDAPQLAGMIARAALETDLARWLVPHHRTRGQIVRDYFQLHLEQALRNGWVDTTADLAGVAVWRAVATGSRPAEPAAAGELVAVTGPYADRFRALHELCAAYHPTGFAHAHLAVMAVQPGRQGQGIGGALLDARHAKLDEHGRAAYLEANSAQVCALYLRHGYQLLPDAPFRLPDGGPAIYPMVRPPCPRRPG